MQKDIIDKDFNNGIGDWIDRFKERREERRDLRTELKEAEVSALTNVPMASTTSESNNTIYYIVGGIALVGILGFIIYKSYKK